MARPGAAERAGSRPSRGEGRRSPGGLTARRRHVAGLPGHRPPGSTQMSADLARAAAGQPPGGEPGAGCPVCGSPANFPLAAAGPACSLRRLARDAERTAGVLAWMAANCRRRDVRIAEFAGVAGISVGHVEAVFERDFGRSPLRVLRDTALHRAHLALTGQAPAPVSMAEAAKAGRVHQRPPLQHRVQRVLWRKARYPGAARCGRTVRSGRRVPMPGLSGGRKRKGLPQ